MSPYVIRLNVFNANCTNLIFQYIWRDNDGRKHDNAGNDIEHRQGLCMPYSDDMVQAETQVHDDTQEDDPQQHCGQLPMEAHEGDQSFMAETQLFPSTDVRRRRWYAVADYSIQFTKFFSKG